MTKKELAVLVAELLNIIPEIQAEELTLKQSNLLNNALALLPPDLRQQYFDNNGFTAKQF